MQIVTSKDRRRIVRGILAACGLLCAHALFAEVALLGVSDNPAGNNLLVSTVGTRVMAVNLGGADTTNNGVNFTGSSAQNGTESGFSYTQSTTSGTFGGAADVHGNSAVDPLFMTLTFFNSATSHTVGASGFDPSKTYLAEFMVGEGRNLTGVFSFALKGTTSNFTITQPNVTLTGSTVNGPNTKHAVRFQFSGESGFAMTMTRTGSTLGPGIAGFQVREIYPSVFFTGITDNPADSNLLVSTTGTRVMAVNFGSATTAINNGVSFTGLTTQNGTESGFNYSQSSIGAFGGSADIHGTNPVDTLFMTIVYFNGTNPHNLTVAGLDTSKSYLVEIMIGEGRTSFSAIWAMQVVGATSGTAASKSGIAIGGNPVGGPQAKHAVRFQFSGEAGFTMTTSLTSGNLGVGIAGFQIRTVEPPGNVFWAPDVAGGQGAATDHLSSTVSKWAGTSGVQGATVQGTNNNLHFTDASGVVTVDGAISVDAGMTVSANGYSFAAGTPAPSLNFIGGTVSTDVITVDSGVTTTIGIPITGATGGLGKSGPGTLILTGANTFTGGTAITGGNLTVSGAGSLNSGTYSAGISIASGSTLTLAMNANQILSGAITGAGNLVQSGANLTLTGANTFTGSTTISSGIVTVSSPGSLTGSSGITINGGSAKYVSTSAVASAVPIVLTQGTLDATGTIGAVSVADAAANTIANGNGGTSALATGALTFSGAATVNVNVSSPTTAEITSTTLTTGAAGKTITVNASNPAWLNNTTYNLIGYTTLAGTGFGSFAKGTVTGLGPRQSAALANPTGFIAITITGESLLWTGLNGGNWTTTVQAPAKNWKFKTAGTAVDFLPSDFVEFDDSAASKTVSINDADVSPLSTTFNNATATYTLSGAFGIATGTLTKNGAGMVIINNSNSFTGATTVNAGVLNLQNGNGLSQSSGVTVVSGGALELQGDLGITSPPIFISGPGAGATPNGALHLVIGSTTVTSQVKLNADAAIQSDASGSLALTHASGITGTNTALTLAGNGDGQILGPIAIGTGALIKNGTGKWTISGALSYSGATTINAGRLTIRDRTFTSTSVAIAANAVLEYAVTTPTGNSLGANDLDDQNVTFTGGGTFLKTGVGNLRFGNSGSVTWNLASGSLIDVQEGILVGAYGNQDNWSNNQSSMNIAAGAMFRGDEADVRLEKLTGSGTLKTGFTNAGTLTVGVNDASSLFAGSIQNDEGTGSLTKTGAGTLSLSGQSTYTGRTLINGGKVQLLGAESVGTSGPLGTGGNITFGGGTLQFSANNAFDFSSRINTTAQDVRIDTNGQFVTFASPLMSGVAGTLVLNDSAAVRGALFINGVNTYTGNTTVIAGDLRGTGSMGSSTVLCANGAAGAVWPGVATLGATVTPGEALIVGGLDLSGGGKLKIALNTANSQQVIVNGNALLSGGVLSLGASSSIPAGSTFTILTSGNSIFGSFGQILLNGDPVVSGGGRITVSVDNGTIPKALKITFDAAVTPITLDSFTAEADGAGVLLRWRCVSEYQNAGFNLFRHGDNGVWTRINTALIPGRLTNPDAKAYSMLDFAPEGVYEYRLQSVSVAGRCDDHAALAGPIAVDALAWKTGLVSEEGLLAACSSAESLSAASLTRELANRFHDEALKETVRGSAERVAVTPPARRILNAVTVRQLRGEPRKPVEPVVPEMSEPPVAARWFSATISSAAKSYVAAKVTSKSAGVLRIPRASLPAGFDIDRVVIQREGRAVTALCVTPDALLLAAPGYEDDYTATDAWFLRSTGARTATGSMLKATGLFDANANAATVSEATLTREFHDVYFDYSLVYRPYNFAPWFSEKYLVNGTTQQFDLDIPNARDGAAMLTINLWSLTQNDSGAADHALQVAVNGAPAGEAQWRGVGKMMQLTLAIPAGALISGSNQISLSTPELPGVSSQVCFLHSLNVSYVAALDGSQPVEVLNASGSSTLYEINHLATAVAWVVDARFPGREALAPYQTQPQPDGSYNLRFWAAPGGTGRHLVVPAGMELAPSAVAKRQVRPVKAVSYIATGPKQLGSAVQPLLTQRNKEGIKGLFVDQEELFDNYNFGRYGPAGIRNAVQSIRPQYLLLLGRTTYDYKNYSGLNVDPMCPAWMVSTNFWAQTTSDSMYGDLGRGYPEVAVGRLPVGNAAELSVSVDRIVHYRGISESGFRLHAVADMPDPQSVDFGQELDALLKQQQPDVTWQENYLHRTWSTPPDVTMAMKEAASGGADIVLYSGHGNASRIGSIVPRILDQTLVQEWTGNTVLLQATCTSNWAAANIPGYRSIAMQALTQPQGGISAAIGSSTYMNSEAAVLFFNQLLKNAAVPNARWGSALAQAQQWAAQQGRQTNPWYMDLSKTEQLFGDPAMPVHGGRVNKTPAGNVEAPGTAAGEF